MSGRHGPTSVLILCTSLFLVITASCGKGTPASPSFAASATAQATKTPTPVPTVVTSPTEIPTPVYTIVPKYQGYYMGTVVISSYYTLLEKELYAEAYGLVTPGLPALPSLTFFKERQRETGQVLQIIGVQPVLARQIQAHQLVTSSDTADTITFYVTVRLIAPINAAATAFEDRIESQYVLLEKEGDQWRIGPTSTSLELAGPAVPVPTTIDPAFVYDLSYYDSLVSIARFHAYFNHGFYREAYDLMSASSPHLASFEDWVAMIKVMQVNEISVVNIYPMHESSRQFQSSPTPDPALRREFYADIYAEGEHGMAGSATNGVHGYFITTLLEADGWKIYSVNTGP